MNAPALLGVTESISRQSDFGEEWIRQVGKPRISLLILQASPFCNVDCDYCYLPDRSAKSRMSMEVVAAVIEKVYREDLVDGPLTIIWHAGEPLAVPISYYEQAFEVIRKRAPFGAEVRHTMQSNGTLLNQAWCDFIKKQSVSIGLSIDGPASIHDAHRKTRSKKGTHEAALRGLRLLRKNDLGFHVISVITRESLGHAEEIYRFFYDLEVPQLGFNIEEIEGVNLTSSVDASADFENGVKDFAETLFRLQKADQGKMRIREFDEALMKIQNRQSFRDLDFPYFNEQVRPFGILSVDWRGEFSTYSPELLGMNLPKYGTFSFGNIVENDLVDAVDTPKFREVFQDIHLGIKRCENSCAHYGYCGGGAPANKYYENGSFATTETLFCRYSIKLPLDIVLEDLEQSVAEMRRGS